MYRLSLGKFGSRLSTLATASAPLNTKSSTFAMNIHCTSVMEQSRHCTKSVSFTPGLSEKQIEEQKDRKPKVPNPASCEAAVDQLQKELDAGRKGFDQKLIDECIESRWVSCLKKLDLEAAGDIYTQDYDRLLRFIKAHEAQLKLMKVEFPPEPTISWHVTNEHFRAMRCYYELAARKLNGGLQSHGKSLEVNGLKDNMSGPTEEIMQKYHDNKTKFSGLENKFVEAQTGKLSVWEVRQMALFFTHEETLSKMQAMQKDVKNAEKKEQGGGPLFSDEEKANFDRHVVLCQKLTALSRVVKQEVKTNSVCLPCGK